jgi:hypothetical protein
MLHIVDIILHYVKYCRYKFTDLSVSEKNSTAPLAIDITIWYMILMESFNLSIFLILKANFMKIRYTTKILDIILQDKIVHIMLHIVEICLLIQMIQNKLNGSVSYGRCN